MPGIEMNPCKIENQPAGRRVGNSYVLISAARDEEAYIPKVLDSVTSQTILPKQWVIVNDGSRDRTGDIVREYQKDHPFISLLEVGADKGRSFGSKALAVRAGYELLKDLEFDFIGNLDADVSFAPTYYESILKKFEANPKLGIAGGVIMDRVNGGFQRSFSNLNHTPGAIQFFRREIFDKIGGYPKLRTGGIDSAAAIMTRMHGWQTKSFEDLEVYHYRREGTGDSNILRARTRQGATDYNLGSHPVFEIVKAARRLAERPWIIGSMLRLYGFFMPLVRGTDRDIPDDVVKFLREEEMKRLKAILRIGSLNGAER